MTVALIKEAFWHEHTDVGWVDAELPASCNPLAILDDGIIFDRDVMCYDYSPGRNELLQDGSRRFFADAWAHKGNIVRAYVENDVLLMNTSFPTMQGASGSPIMVNIDDECCRSSLERAGKTCS